MNILILVSSFLLILSFGVATLVKHSTAGILKQTYFNGTMTVEKNLHNSAQRTQFDRTVKKKRTANTSTAPKAPKKDRAKKVKRDQVAVAEKSKFNLVPLFKPPVNNQLYEIAAKLLKDIYGGDTGITKAAQLLSISDFEYRILDALIAKAQAEKEFSSLEDLMPDEQNLKELFLKMMRGTKHYTLATKQGYPPLGDFFTVDSKRSKAISFCFASTPLLKAVFGPKITAEINEEEQKKALANKSPSLNSKELETLLKAIGDPQITRVKMDPLMDFSRRVEGKKEIAITDSKTKIRHKIHLPATSTTPSGAK